MKDRAVQAAAPGMRGGPQRVNDEFGAHVVGDRPAHQTTRAQIHDRGQVWVPAWAPTPSTSSSATGSAPSRPLPAAPADDGRVLGHQDVLVWQDGTGILWLYPGESVRGISGQKPVRLGEGWDWRSGRWPCNVADYDGDGHQDIIAADVATREVDYPDLWIYPGESHRGVSTQEPVRIFSGVSCFG